MRQDKKVRCLTNEVRSSNFLSWLSHKNEYISNLHTRRWYRISKVIILGSISLCLYISMPLYLYASMPSMPLCPLCPLCLYASISLCPLCPLCLYIPPLALNTKCFSHLLRSLNNLLVIPNNPKQLNCISRCSTPFKQLIIKQNVII